MSELNHKMNRYKAMNVAKNEEIRFSKNVNNFKIEKKEDKKDDGNNPLSSL